MAKLTASPALSNSPMDYDYENDTVSPVLAAANSSISTFDAGIELLSNSLHTYYTPLLVLLGSIGNVISIYVFYVSKLRIHSASLYLSVLAISDTIFLIQLLPPWLNAMQITNLFHRPGFCQVIVYSTYASCCCSAWLVVAFTVERCVAVVYPLRCSQMCTVARAKFVIGVLVVISMMVNLPVLKFASSSVNDCNIDSEYIDKAARFNVADTMLSFTMPLGLIVLLNSRIVAKMWSRGRERRVVQAAIAACPHYTAPLRALPDIRTQQRVTRMLLLVSSVFVVLNVPAYAMRIAAYAFDMNTGDYCGRWAALQQLALTFFNTNFGINFILYCLSGQNFRRELCQSVPCLRNFRRRIDELQLSSRYRERASSVISLEFGGLEIPRQQQRFSYAPSQSSSGRELGSAEQPRRLQRFSYAPSQSSSGRELGSVEQPRRLQRFSYPRSPSPSGWELGGVELPRQQQRFSYAPSQSSSASYESAHTPGTSFVIVGQPPSRDQRSEPFIEKWTFDNTRTLRMQVQSPTQPPAQPHLVRRSQRTLPSPAEAEAIEMRELGDTELNYEPDDVPIYPVQDAQPEADEERDRSVSFPLFPFTRLLIPKKKRSSSVSSGTSN